MNVAELIKELDKFPSDMKVFDSLYDEINYVKIINKYNPDGEDFDAIQLLS